MHDCKSFQNRIFGNSDLIFFCKLKIFNLECDFSQELSNNLVYPLSRKTKNYIFRYNPYDKSFTREYYEFEQMMQIRHEAILKARKASTFGVILGTLGRQGNPRISELFKNKVKSEARKHFIVLLSEIFPQKLELFPNVEAWVQIACPRLSIDWGKSFAVPVLTPYEAAVALNQANWNNKSYPMDFYSSDSLGDWTPNHKPPKVSISSEKCKSCDNCKNKDKEKS